MSIGCKYTPGQVPMLTWNHRLLGRSISRQCPSDSYLLQFSAFIPIHISTRDTTGIPPKDKNGSWYLDLPLVDEWSYGKSTVIQVCIRVSTCLNGVMGSIKPWWMGDLTAYKVLPVIYWNIWGDHGWTTNNSDLWKTENNHFDILGVYLPVKHH